MKESSVDPNDGSQSDYQVGETGNPIINDADFGLPDFGCNVTYETESSFTFGASIGGYISAYATYWYNDTEGRWHPLGYG